MDWSAVASTTMADFLSRYTLHDSWVQKFVVDPGAGQATLRVGFDLNLNQAVPEGYDTLLIHFFRLYSQRSVHGAWSQPTLTGAESAALPAAERVRLLDSSEFDLRGYQGAQDDIPHPANDEQLSRTVFWFVNWGRAELLHGARVCCIAQNKAGETLDLAADAPGRLGNMGDA